MESKGMKFARQMMEKMGWEEGKGLGVNQQGMTEAIKPSGKFNVSGLGHKAFNDFQWWDHAFNKAAQAFEIKLSDEQGPLVEKVDNVGKLSTKKSSSSTTSESLAYGVFQKTGTLSNGVEKTTITTPSAPAEDFSVKLSDEDLFRLCGGRTAHKGARHGLTASGKLARIAQQEAELLEKLRSSEKKTEEKHEKKKNKLKLASEQIPDVSPEQAQTQTHAEKEQSDPAEPSSVKKSKKEKRKRKEEREESPYGLFTTDKSKPQEINNQDEATDIIVEQEVADVIVKKKKKKFKGDHCDESPIEETRTCEAPKEETNTATSETVTKKKKKDKTKSNSDK